MTTTFSTRWFASLAVLALLGCGQGASEGSSVDQAIDPLDVTLEFTAVADSFARADYASKTNGALTVLEVDATPDYIAYLRFQARGIVGTVKSARVMVYATNGSGNGPALHTTGSAWSESALNWTNHPAPGTRLADLGSVGTGWISFDATAAVKADGSFDFAVVPTSTDGFDFQSRENTNKPKLVVVFAQATQTVVCGNGACDSGESCSSCPGDCGQCPVVPPPATVVCGNSTCDAGESCSTCPGDCGQCPSGTGPKIWVTDSTRKILPTAAPLSTATRHQLFAAKNEFEALQLVVQGPADNVRVTGTALSGPGTVPAPHLFREELINITSSSASDGWTGRTPDAMIPDKDDVVGETRKAFPFSVPAGENRVIWVEYLVPQTATAGDYSGSLTVTSSQGTATANVGLTVWNFALPSTSSLRSHFSLSYGGLPAGHGVPFGAEFSRLRARYSQLALDHRISLGKFDDGNFASTSNFDTYYGPLVAGTAPTQLPGARQTSVEYLGGGFSTWTNFFAGKGWPKILFQYTCDEPPQFCAWSDIPTRAAQARAAGVATLVTTNIAAATSNNVLSSIDIIVPVINHLDDKSGTFYGDQSAKYSAFQAPGDIKELWTYQSCMSHGCGGSATGWASYMIDGQAIRSRAQEWLSFYWGATGELYFETVYAYTKGDAWATQYYYTGNGDGTLFFPGTPAKIGGTTHIPVASLRLKMIREGYEDYEYLKLLADKGDRAFAVSVAKTLFPHPYQVEPPVADLMAARQKLAARIIQLNGGTVTPSTQCSDGTAANACSSSKPMQCLNGALVAACEACGCPSGQVCQTGGSCSAPPQAVGYTAQALASAPAIDGNLGEYGALPAMSLDGISVNGSAQVRAAYDAQALYLAYDVTDNQLVAASTSEDGAWDTDSVELMIDALRERASSADANDFHVLVTAAGQLSDSRGWTDYTWASGARLAVNRNGASVPGASINGGYKVELRVPWSAMGLTPSAGLQLGFDVAINDKDSATGGLLSQDLAGLTRFNNPAGWATLTLGPGLVLPPDGSADAGTPPPPDAGTTVTPPSLTTNTSDPSQLHLSWRGATDTTMVATFRSNASSAQCWFGATTAYERGSVAAAKIPYSKISNGLFTVEMTGLSPGTTYHYRCGSAALGYAPDQTFRTAPARGSTASARFAVFADMQTYNSAQDANRVRMIGTINSRFGSSAPAFALVNGDFCDIGGYQYQWDGMFKAAEPLARRTPMMPSLAGHEFIDRDSAGTNIYRTDAPEYFAQFVLPTHPAASGYQDEAYYSFNYGPLHVISLGEPVLPSGVTDGGPQKRWLEQDLIAASQDANVKWIVVFEHLPPYSAGRYSSYGEVRTHWVPLFERYGVAVVFNAHNHNYQRSKMLKAGVPVASGGVIYAGVGGMSADVPYACNSPLPSTHEKCLQVRTFADVEVSATSLTLTAIRDDGVTVDTFTLDKPGTPTTSSASACGDGTAEGRCSASQPMQCQSGALVAACGSCGCPTGQVCQANGGCMAAGVYTAANFTAAPTVDGQLTEYAGLPSISLTGKSTSGSAQVRVGWTSQALFLGYDVIDQQLLAASGAEGDLWNGDGVEVMFDTGVNRTATADLNDFHYVLGPSGLFADSRGWTDYGFTSGLRRAIDLRGAVVPGPATGYRVEVSIPWSAMGVTPSAGLRLGFDVAFNDKDSATGGVISQDMMGLSAFNNPARWGTLVLAPPGSAGSYLSLDTGLGDDAFGDAANDYEVGTPVGAAEASAGAFGCSAAAGGAAWPIALLAAALLRRRRP